ncbi:MAG TPA: hypothetical protein VFC60_01480 [Tissierellaceae bacterium]|nr:hypothetical protein [Tissierellaceae bacterium]
MRNKKYIIISILAILLLFSVYIYNYNSLSKKISRDLGVYMPNNLNFEYEDTHHWFLGDGITLAEADLNEKQLNQIIGKADTDWNESPIPIEIKEIIYEPSRSILEMENGYWIFKDRKSKESKERFPDAITGNYSLGVIDLDTDTFYYIKFDS